MRVDAGIALLEEEPAREELLDQLEHLGVRGVEGVPADVEDPTVVLDGPTQAADVGLLFEDEGIALEGVGDGKAGGPGADDQRLDTSHRVAPFLWWLAATSRYSST